MSNLNLDRVLADINLTTYGLSLKIQAVTGEDRRTVHKRINKWVKTGVPPKFEIADRDLRILGYAIEIIKLK